MKLQAMRAAAAAVLSVAVSLPAAAATLFSDNFDADAAGLNAPLLNWTVGRGTIDVIGAGFFNFYPGNGRYVDMDGSTNSAGRIDTKDAFALVVGQSYRLSFSYGRNGISAETMRFGVSGSLAESFSLPASPPSNEPVPATLQPFSLEFVAAASSGRIFFDHAGGDNGGIILDNVLLESIDRAAVVPVPAGLPLMLGGLVALGFAASRRRG